MTVGRSAQLRQAPGQCPRDHLPQAPGNHEPALSARLCFIPSLSAKLWFTRSGQGAVRGVVLCGQSRLSGQVMVYDAAKIWLKRQLEGASTLGVAAGDARGAALRRHQRHFSALGAEIGVQADDDRRGRRICQAIRGAGVEAGDPRWLPGDPVQVATQDLGDRIRERERTRCFPKPVERAPPMPHSLR